MAKHCFLDWLGVTIAGAQEASATLLRAVLAEEGAKPVATFLGTQTRGSIRGVAEGNGTAAHALDFDDLHVPAHLPYGAIGHPSAPVIAALLALAEANAVNGKEFLTALVAGVEVECRVGVLVAPGHYAAGWHSTATIGTFGAAAACARVLRLDMPKWLHTLGLAGVQAQGLKSAFGTMAKPFQVGKAAGNGLQSALLAARGYTSNQQVLECVQGFCATQSPTYSEFVPEGYEILKTRFKKYACCGGTHPTIEGALSLMREYLLSPDQISRVVIRVNPSRDQACNIQEPRTPLECKFSLQFVTAMALTGSDLSSQAFTEACLRDHAVAALLSRIHVELVEQIEKSSSLVRIELHDGRTVDALTHEGAPEPDKRQEWSDLVGKFKGLVYPILGRERADALIQLVAHLEEVASIAEITTLCTV